MKKDDIDEYLAPEIEVMEFKAQSVLCLSGSIGDMTVGDIQNGDSIF